MILVCFPPPLSSEGLSSVSVSPPSPAKTSPSSGTPLTPPLSPRAPGSFGVSSCLCLDFQASVTPHPTPPPLAVGRKWCKSQEASLVALPAASLFPGPSLSLMSYLEAVSPLERCTCLGFGFLLTSLKSFLSVSMVVTSSKLRPQSSSSSCCILWVRLSLKYKPKASRSGKKLQYLLSVRVHMEAHCISVSSRLRDSVVGRHACCFHFNRPEAKARTACLSCPKSSGLGGRAGTVVVPSLSHPDPLTTEGHAPPGTSSAAGG